METGLGGGDGRGPTAEPRRRRSSEPDRFELRASPRTIAPIGRLWLPSALLLARGPFLQVFRESGDPSEESIRGERCFPARSPDPSRMIVKATKRAGRYGASR
eukprot:scaffold869_cov303-Pinguiococcus_pyrenoidosus.AAC.13